MEIRVLSQKRGIMSAYDERLLDIEQDRYE